MKEPRSITSRFFEFTQEASAMPKGTDFTDSAFSDSLDMFSAISIESFYVIDLHKRQFCYVSPNASFLCGYDAGEALRLGYDLYPKIVHSEDLQLLIKMHKAALRYFEAVGKRDNEIDYFSCTFRLQHNYSFLSKPLPQMVYHRMKPVWRDGRLRYFICSVDSSTVKASGYPRMYHKDGLTYEEYSFTTHRWKRVTIEWLTERERAILMLAQQGKRGSEIADCLYIGYKTLEKQTTMLYLKLGVRSMMEAVSFASNHNLIYSPKHNICEPERLSLESPRRRIRTLASSDLLQRIQQALDNGQSIREAAREEGIAEGSVRYWIKQGRLMK